jgi:hypothetical protein
MPKKRKQPRSTNQQSYITKAKHHIKPEYWKPAMEYLTAKGIDTSFDSNITQKLSLASKSKDRYESDFRAFRYFCCLIGITSITKGIMKV